MARRDTHAPELFYGATAFVGRGQELDQIIDAMSASRLVTLTGPGGIGKSRLAVEAARRVGDQFTDGVCLVELSGLSDARLLPHTVAVALGCTTRRTRAPPRTR